MGVMGRIDSEKGGIMGMWVKKWAVKNGYEIGGIKDGFNRYVVGL